MYVGQDWHSLMWLWFPQVPECLVSPAVTRLDPQHTVYGVRESEKLQSNVSLDRVLNLGLDGIVLLTPLVFLSLGAAVLVPLKKRQNTLTLWIKEPFRTATVDGEGCVPLLRAEWMCYTVTLNPNSKWQEKIWVVKNTHAPKISGNEWALYQVIYHGHHMREGGIAALTWGGEALLHEAVLPHLQSESHALWHPSLFSAFLHWSSDSLCPAPHHATSYGYAPLDSHECASTQNNKSCQKHEGFFFLVYFVIQLCSSWVRAL